MKQVRITKETNLITHAEHWHTACCLLDRAEFEAKGSYHQYLACITFIAFTLEAFLNHIGEALFDSWMDLEQLNVRGKFAIISDKLRLVPDYGAMPWQIVPELVAFRNKVAHGKNERLFEEIVLPEDKYDDYLNKFLQTQWQQTATMSNAKRFKEQLRQLCLIIWKASGQKEESLFALSHQFGSASLDD